MIFLNACEHEGLQSHLKDFCRVSTEFDSRGEHSRQVQSPVHNGHLTHPSGDLTVSCTCLRSALKSECCHSASLSFSHPTPPLFSPSFKNNLACTLWSHTEKYFMYFFYLYTEKRRRILVCGVFFWRGGGGLLNWCCPNSFTL